MSRSRPGATATSGRSRSPRVAPRSVAAPCRASTTATPVCAESSMARAMSSPARSYRRSGNVTDTWRPERRYSLAGRQVSVPLPARRYDLAGELMGRAIEDSAQTGVAVVDALHGAATDLGATLGERLRPDVAVAPGRERLIAAACGTLSAHGYEPRRQGDTITMANCRSTRWPASTPRWCAA